MKLAPLGIAVLFLLIGCKQQYSASAIRTDIAPITRRLPQLGPLQSVRWQSVEITTDSFPAPPPLDHIYRVRGLARLEKTKAEEFSQKYEWQKMPASWTPDISVEDANEPLPDWNHSAAFTKDCKPSQSPGELYFERSSGVVYFDIKVQ